MRSEEITARALEMLNEDRYKLSILVSKRAEQLSNGAEPLVENIDNLKPVDLALLEIAEGKVGIELLEERKA